MSHYRNLVRPTTDHLCPRMIVRHPVLDVLGLVRTTWMFTVIVDWPWGQCYCSPEGLEIVRPKQMVPKVGHGKSASARQIPPSHPDAL